MMNLKLLSICCLMSLAVIVNGTVLKDTDINTKLALQPGIRQYIDELIAELSEKFETKLQNLHTRHENDIASMETLIYTLTQNLEKEQEKHFEEIAAIKSEMQHLKKQKHDKSTLRYDSMLGTGPKNSTKRIAQDAFSASVESHVRRKVDLAINGDYTDFQQEQQAFEQNCKEKRSSDVEKRVVFFATLNVPLKYLGANQDIVFDNVITNTGNAYNSHHGTFIAPFSGTYVFCCTLHISGPQTYGHFVVNQEVIAKLNVKEEQSSQTIIVKLKHGDDVSVQNAVSNRGIHGEKYSTFGGFLLYEDFSSPEILG